MLFLFILILIAVFLIGTHIRIVAQSQAFVVERLEHT